MPLGETTREVSQKLGSVQLLCCKILTFFREIQVFTERTAGISWVENREICPSVWSRTRFGHLEDLYVQVGAGWQHALG